MQDDLSCWILFTIHLIYSWIGVGTGRKRLGKIQVELPKSCQCHGGDVDTDIDIWTSDQRTLRLNGWTGAHGKIKIAWAGSKELDYKLSERWWAEWNSQGKGKSHDEEKARIRRRYLVTKKRDIDFTMMVSSCSIILTVRSLPEEIVMGWWNPHLKGEYSNKLG